MSQKITRRQFTLQGAGALAVTVGGPAYSFAAPKDQQTQGFRLVARTDLTRILRAADAALGQQPITLVDIPGAGSPGGPHDYFSQADYFWPDPSHPDGPYVNRDGQSNPDNFDGHRRAMVRLSLLVPQLTAAWVLTGERRYGEAACRHLRAWFVAPATRMNPNLEFSQGVRGVSTGRSYGIIDTLHLVEVARSAALLAPSVMTKEDHTGVSGWFRDYLEWMTTSEKGRTERTAKNNHATCWALQAAEFARVTGDEGLRDEIRGWYRNQLLTVQMAADGSFPQELTRTKPYSYSIFNFDVTGCLAQSLNSPHGDSMTRFALPDGRGLCRAAAWIYPYLQDREKWPYRHDVQHFDSLPVRTPALLFAGLACNRPEYLALWQRLDSDPTDREIVRNYPVRQPLLWV